MPGHFEIVAHRGIRSEQSENTLAGFERAIALGADAVEFDVCLTADGVPIVFHDVYLDGKTDGRGPIFARTLEELRGLRVRSPSDPGAAGESIPTLEEVVDRIGGWIGMEIEIKGPEPEAPGLVAGVLKRHPQLRTSVEVTSFEPALLLDFQKASPDVPADVLVPLFEGWMRADAVAYEAIHRALLAEARAVHLHASQLVPETVSAIRSHGIAIHAWGVDEKASLEKIQSFRIPRICTDCVREALEFRRAGGYS
ncbi:MAG: hypothetical protein JW929_02030 [Anaerolineales bacterium]|nr:hypothetical protein [Anaerolineales bacterium]